MTLTGNRAFFALVAVAFAAYHLLGAGACALFSFLVYGVSTRGLEFASTNPWGFAALVVFLLLYGLGWVLGLVSLVRQISATLRLRRRVATLLLPKPPALVAAETRAGLPGRVDVVDAAQPFSFAYGIVSPRVAVSRGLIDSVTTAELDAVLAHESYHLRNRDPLKVVVARTLPAAFFYLPVLRDLRARYISGRELAADRRAMSAHGERPLAGALYKVARGPAWAELGAAAAIGGPELLEARVTQLETGREPTGGDIGAAVWIATLVGALVVALSLGLAAASFDIPLDAFRDRGPMRPDEDMRDGGFFMGFFFWIVVAGVIWRFYRRRGRRRLGPS